MHLLPAAATEARLNVKPLKSSLRTNAASADASSVTHSLRFQGQKGTQGGGLATIKSPGSTAMKRAIIAQHPVKPRPKSVLANMVGISEAARPREYPGIPRMKCVLASALLTLIAVLSIPLIVNLTELQDLRRSLLKVASSDRREVVVWLLGSYLAHLERVSGCGTDPSMAPGQLGPAELLDFRDALGELAFIQHRLVFCDAPHDTVGYFGDYIDGSLSGCPRGRLADSLSKGKRSTAFDLRVEVDQVTGDRTITAFDREVLTDDFTQQIIYDARELLRNTSSVFPVSQWRAPVFEEIHWLAGAALVNRSSEYLRTVLQDNDRTCVAPAVENLPEFEDYVGNWISFVYNT